MLKPKSESKDTKKEKKRGRPKKVNDAPPVETSPKTEDKIEIKPELKPEPAPDPEIAPKQEKKPSVDDDSGLEDRPFFSIDETARFLGVSEGCARLWFNHGHLGGLDDKGFIRVSRSSILRCKFRKIIG